MTWPAVLTTPRRPATATRSWRSPRGQPTRRLGWAPTGKRQPSTTAPCASAASLTVADRADLLERFAYELYITDQIEPAIEARHRALAEWTLLGDGLRCGDNLRWLSRLSWFVPRGEDARRYAAQAIEVLEAYPPGRELAWAYSNQAQLCMLALDVEGARRWAPRAIELGQTLGDVEVVAHAMNNLGTAALIVDDETGVELLERSLALSLGAGLEEHAARAYANLGSESVMHRRYEAAVRTLDAGIAYCDERGLDTLARYMGAWLARTRLELGQWDAAAEAAAVVIADASSPLARSGALVVLGRIRARRGDPGVWPLLDEAMSIAVAAAELQRTAPVAAGRLEAAWLAGDATPEVPFAREVLEEAERSSDAWAAGELAVLLHRDRCPLPSAVGGGRTVRSGAGRRPPSRGRDVEPDRVPVRSGDGPGRFGRRRIGVGGAVGARGARGQSGVGPGRPAARGARRDRSARTPAGDAGQPGRPHASGGRGARPRP